MTDHQPSRPYPPRWVSIYLLVLGLGLIVWIILDVMHGAFPGATLGDHQDGRTQLRTPSKTRPLGPVFARISRIDLFQQPGQAYYYS